MIPVNSFILGEAERRNLIDCIDSGWISSEGPYVQRFEEQFSACVQRKHGIAVSNGTAALEVAVAALGIGPGDEVIMPTFTIISCPLAVVRSGAMPIVVDSDPETWNMDLQQIEGRITPRTKVAQGIYYTTSARRA